MLLLMPAQPVHKHTSSYYSTSLTPLMDAIRVGLECLIVRETIVVHLSCLMSEVLQRILINGIHKSAAISLWATISKLLPIANHSEC